MRGKNDWEGKGEDKDEEIYAGAEERSCDCVTSFVSANSMASPFGDRINLIKTDPQSMPPSSAMV